MPKKDTLGRQQEYGTSLDATVCHGVVEKSFPNHPQHRNYNRERQTSFGTRMQFFLTF